MSINKQEYKRKLAAILSADVEGYSRLMSQDETATVNTLKAYKGIIRRLVLSHNGRVVDSPGDNILAEFASVVDAVRCALEIQNEIKKSNAALPQDRKMLFRIGVNLGDVIEDGARIYGDGVNIAARVEGLAKGGGICISGNTYDQIQNKIPVGCEFIGKQTVKNIAAPIPIYRIWQDSNATGCKVETALPPKPRKKIYVTAAAAAAFVLIAAVALFLNHTESLTFRPTGDDVTGPYPKLSPAKPTIAVLPFENLSKDADQEYFSDGITNDIITDLSKFRELAVTASKTVFKFKGKSIDVRELGRDLNVDYVIEGSVQKAGSRVRINAQLIDASSGNHIWADRYDRKITDIFELQDEIIETVVRKLALKVDETERARAMRKDTTNLEAYDYILRGYHQYYKRDRDSVGKAKVFFKKAIALDPSSASAYVGLAKVRRREANFGWTEFPDKAYQQAETLLKKALSIDDTNTGAHTELGYVYMRHTKYDLAISELERAIELNPNDWRTYRLMAPVMLYSGRTDEALKWYHAALRYDPALSPGMLMNMGIAYFLKEQNDEAIKWLRKSLDRWPNFLGNHIVLTAVYIDMGQLDKARQEADEVLRISPFFQVDFYGKAFHNPEHRAKIVGALRKAGLS